MYCVQLQLQRNRLTTINACAFDNALELEEIWLTGNIMINHCVMDPSWRHLEQSCTCFHAELRPGLYFRRSIGNMADRKYNSLRLRSSVDVTDSREQLGFGRFVSMAD